MRKLQIENESLLTQLDRVDDRVEQVRLLMERVNAADLNNLWTQLDISAIYHDCALEGEVISPEELNSALDPKVVTDATNLTLYSSIRNHKKAFELCRHYARQPKLRITKDLFFQFHQIFTPGEQEITKPGYRMDIPLHRTYFHEIHQADQIDDAMTELISWMDTLMKEGNSHPISFAVSFHHRFMHIFPFPDTSGKVGRAVMNILLLRNGFLPAVLHATERQRYYEAIRGPKQELVTLVIDAELAALDSASRFLRRTSTLATR